MLLEQIKWGDSPEDTLDKFKSYFDEEKNNFDSVHKKGERNFKYWSGTYFDTLALNSIYEHKVVENRIFESIESLVPIAKNRAPEPAVYVSPRTGENYALESQLKSALVNMWRDRWEMPGKLTKLVRHDYLYYWGVLKFEYDPDTDDFNFSVRDPQKIWARFNVDCLAESDIVIEECELELYKMIELYPADKETLMEVYGRETGTRIKYYELWTDDFVLRTDLNWLKPFGKQKNPHWNWEETNNDAVVRQTPGYEGEIIPATVDTGLFTHNFFAQPRKPYEDFAGFRSMSQLTDSTSLIEQAGPLQEALDRLLVQMDVVAQDNGVDVFNTTIVDEQVAREFKDRGPKASILASGNAGDAMNRVAPNRQLSDLASQAEGLRNAIDNVFGTHSTTRGERNEPETATGRQILLGGDMSRGLPSAEALANLAQRIYDWAIQGFMVYYTTPRAVPSSGRDDFTISQSDFVSADPETGEEQTTAITITVGQEAVIPVDKAKEAESAIQLAQGGMLDFKTLYEKLGYSDPDITAYRTLLMKTQPDRYIVDILGMGPEMTQPLGQPAGMGGTQQPQPAQQDEAVGALEAILQGQDAPPPSQPTPQGLAMIQQFPNTPEYGQMPPEGKMKFKNYLELYSQSLGGGQNAGINQ